MPNRHQIKDKTMLELLPIDEVKLHPTARIAKNVTLLHDITIGENSSVWPGVVARGDHHAIVIGNNSNVQDNAIIHVSHDSITYIGNNVTVGHGAIIHGCTINDNCIIGMGAVVMDNAIIGEDSVIGAGAVISKGVVIPPHSIVMGIPGKVRREATQGEVNYNAYSAWEYAESSKQLADAGVFWYGNQVPDGLDSIRLKKD